MSKREDKTTGASIKLLVSQAHIATKTVLEAIEERSGVGGDAWRMAFDARHALLDLYDYLYKQEYDK